MALLPMAMYGLEVPPGDFPMMAHADIPAAFRVTMAAIDPSADPEGDEDEISRPRATLKVIRFSPGDEDDFDEDEMSVEDMDAQFGDADGLDDDSEDSDDEDITGGPSDPSKSKNAMRAAAQKEIERLVAEEGMDVEDDGDDDDEDMPNGINGFTKSPKALGKMPASDEDSDLDSADLDDEGSLNGGEIEEFVICTLDPEKHYQQPLDITFGERERVWFKVTGTHTIYLTGNYVEPIDNNGPFDPDSDEEEEYDLSPDEDELDDSEDESIDGLDDLADPRITELDEDEDAPPPLVKAEIKKKEEVSVPKKNKRPAPEPADEDEAMGGAEGLDEMIANEAKVAQAGINGSQQLSKSQLKKLKKLKKNDGLAGAAPVVEETKQEVLIPKDADLPASVKSDKKVTFANQLEQGPTPTKADKTDKPKSSVGVKIVQGVTIDDRKIGTGQSAKKGDRVGMRYIGKLENNKIFDSNKSGKPFSFKLGAGDVIKGWEIGVEGMKAGSERRLTIPAHMAYGSKKMGEIPPNSTLIFDIKLLDINKGK